MFNNLIESSSHTREFKRRGSFFLFTIGAYALLFVVGGVASIYAYDAHLEEQTDEIVTMLQPVDFPAAPPRNLVEPERGPKSTSREQTQDVRQTPMASVDTPQLQPSNISTKPNPSLPVRLGIPTVIGKHDSNGNFAGPLGSGSPSGSGNTPAMVQLTEIPPPPVVQKPVPQVIHRFVINGDAIELPKPPYPGIAKQTRIQGVVNVQVLIDENGKVVSAHALNGHPLLTADAVRAAYRARFSPTKIGDQPVKVSGVITYNFVLN